MTKKLMRLAVLLLLLLIGWIAICVGVIDEKGAAGALVVSLVIFMYLDVGDAE